MTYKIGDKILVINDGSTVKDNSLISLGKIVKINNFYLSNGNINHQKKRFVIKILKDYKGFHIKGTELITIRSDTIIKANHMTKKEIEDRVMVEML